MENHKSSEKLVGLEAGVISPPIPKNISYVKRIGSSSNKCTHWLLALLAIALLVVVSYEIRQAVRNEQFMSQIGYQNSMKLEEPTSLPVLAEASIQDMKEELKRLQNELKEVKEKITEQDLTRPATEIPKKISSQESTVETTEYDSLSSLSKEDTADNMMPFHSNSIILKSFDSPKLVIAEEDVSQDFQKPDLVPLLVNDPVGEPGGGFFWSFGIKFHDRSGDSDSEDQNGTELKKLEAVTSTETDIKSSAEDSNGYIDPPEKRFKIIWEWNNQSDDDHKSPESEEEVRKQISSKETQTEAPTPETPVDEYDMDGYDEYDTYWDSYEYYSQSEENEKPTPSPTKSVFEVPTTESSLTSTVSEDEEELEETATTETTVTSTPEIHGFSSNEKDDTTDFYNWGLPFDTEFRFPDLDATPNNEEGTESTNTEEALADASSRDDALLQEREINKYLQLVKQRLAEIERLNHLYDVSEAKEEYTDDENVTANYDDDDDLGPYRLKFPEPEGWSYISKRSVDTAPALESPTTSLTAKELERKLSVVQQKIDQENHLIDNEVSRTPEPSKRVLQEKLNRFYAKMEAVAAHIDRLHERYVRLNKLDDDYVSREFPSEDDMNGLGASSN